MFYSLYVSCFLLCVDRSCVLYYVGVCLYLVYIMLGEVLVVTYFCVGTLSWLGEFCRVHLMALFCNICTFFKLFLDVEPHRMVP